MVTCITVPNQTMVWPILARFEHETGIIIRCDSIIANGDVTKGIALQCTIVGLPGWSLARESEDMKADATEAHGFSLLNVTKYFLGGWLVI